MKFSLFLYCSIGRRHEIEAGMAGKNPVLYQRMLAEIADYAKFADEHGYYAMGHPEHHLQIEGMEISNEPGLMSMWIGTHSRKLRVNMIGFVSTTHNPLRAAEYIATLDNMVGGRLGVGMVRGYQARWVENFRVRDDLHAVGTWNKDSADDDLNRDYFAEWVEIVVTALTNETFSYKGKFWQFPPADFVKNPHPHVAYTSFGAGVDDDMTVREIGIAPRPLQTPHPPLYGGFTGSMRTALWWARYGGKPIVLADNLDFCKTLWDAYHEEQAKHGHDIPHGESAGWGGIMICAKTDAEAQERAKDMLWLWENWSTQFKQPLPEMLVGSPETITRRIQQAKDHFGPTDIHMIIPQGLHPPEWIIESLDLFSSKVMPNFA